MNNTFFEKIREFCRENPQRVLFTEGCDERVVRAARILTDEFGFETTLLGGTFEIRDLASATGIITRGLRIINPLHEKEYTSYAQLYRWENPDKKHSQNEIISIFKNPHNFGLASLRYNHTDLVFGGNDCGIVPLAKAALKFLKIKSGYQRASAYYLMFSPKDDKKYIFTDCSLNITPTAEQLAEIAEHAAKKYMHIFKSEARVTFLSFSTKGSATHPNVDRSRSAFEIFTKKNPGITCEGELQFDAAVVSAVAQKKAPNSRLNGNANVFIFPAIDSGNIGQKIAEHIAGYKSVGPLLQGFDKDVHVLPKGCTREHIINNVLYASFLKLTNCP